MWFDGVPWCFLADGVASSLAKCAMRPIVSLVSPRVFSLSVATVVLVATSVTAVAQKRAPPFVAPPRTIADITAILDQQKHDPKHLAKLRADAYAAPPAGLGRDALLEIPLRPRKRQSGLGPQSRGARDGRCAEKAIKAVGAKASTSARFRRLCNINSTISASPRRRCPRPLAERARERTRTRPARQQGRGWLFNNYRQIARSTSQLGDMAQAEPYVRTNQGKIVEARRIGRPIPTTGWAGKPTSHKAASAASRGARSISRGRSRLSPSRGLATRGLVKEDGLLTADRPRTNIGRRSTS